MSSTPMSEAKGPYTLYRPAEGVWHIDRTGDTSGLSWAVFFQEDDAKAAYKAIVASHHHALAAQAERVRELEDREGLLFEALEACRTNDRSETYEYGEKRKLDEAAPPKGQRWSTPFEISRDAIGEWAKRVFGKAGVQGLASAFALTPPAKGGASDSK